MPNNGPDEPIKSHTMSFPKEGNASADHAPLRGRWSAQAAAGPPGRLEPESTEPAAHEPLDSERPSEEVAPDVPTTGAAAKATSAPVVPLVEDLRQLIRTLEGLASALEAIDTLLHQDIGASVLSPFMEPAESASPPNLMDVLARQNSRPDLHSVLRQYLLR